MLHRFTIVLVFLLTSTASGMDFVQVSKDQKGFVLSPSEKPFVPWGLNYGCTTQLIEEYWDSDWDRVVADFEAMKGLGANVVRVHLQTGHFMDGPEKPNEHALRQLGRLVRLAEKTGIYLDLTGLGGYRSADNPKWYDAISEKERWAVQTRFWDAVAGECADSPAIFCYDLMNEPMVPSGTRKAGDWLSGKPMGGLDFVQWISLDRAERPREEIAPQWIQTLSAGIRKHDRRHLITVGLMPSTPQWGYFSGFVPDKIAADVDFISVHIYPATGKNAEALATLKGFAVGKPVVIEETFPLACSAAELKDFLLDSRPLASGWLGHYGGDTPQRLEALRKSKEITIPQSMMLEWLILFRDLKSDLNASS